MKEASGALERVAGYIKLRQERVTIDEPLVRLITQIMAAYLKLCLRTLKQRPVRQKTALKL